MPAVDAASRTAYQIELRSYQGDYQLRGAVFGDALATATGTIENSALTPPEQVPGLEDFLFSLAGAQRPVAEHQEAQQSDQGTTDNHRQEHRQGRLSAARFMCRVNADDQSHQVGDAAHQCAAKGDQLVHGG